MSQKDSSSKIKAQPGAIPASGKKAGSTKYKMQAAQLAQEAAKIAAEQEAQARAQKEAAARGESQSEDTVRGLWKSRVLASYKSKGSKDSNTLLAKISDGKAALEVGDRHISANVQEVMINTVDKMFDIFQNCAYEFNKIAAGSELEINWIRPFLSKEVTANWHAQEHANLIFSGRVSTRRWTMVIKGTTEEIIAFILPADKLIGFALSANNFKPYFAMTPVSDKLDVHWQIEDHIMPPELFPTIYKELFDGLIRFAREEAHPDEVFTLRKIGITIPNETEQTQAEEDQARQKLYQEQFFQDMRSREDFQPVKQVPEFAKPEPRPAPTPQLANPTPTNLSPPNHLNSTPHLNPTANPTSSSNLTSAASPTSTSTGGWKQVPEGNLHNPENARLLAERSVPQARPPQQITPQMPAQQAPQAPQAPAAPQSQHSPQMPQMHPQQQQSHPQQHMPTMNPQWPSLQAPVSQAPQPPMPQPAYPSQPQYPPQQAHQLHQPQIQQPRPQAPQQQQAMQPQQVPQQAPQPPAQPQHKPRPANFPEALSSLLSCLDQELEVVAKAGSDAFAQRDLARADAALKFSGRLTEFRTLARELYEYYGGGKPNQ